MSSSETSRRQRHRRRVFESALLALVLGIGVAVLTNDSTSRPETGAAARPRSGAAGRSRRRTEPSPASLSTTTSPSTTTSTTNPDEITGLFTSATIDDYLQGQDSDINAAVYDLRTGQLSLYRPGALEYTASIVKVDILATLLHQTEQQGTGLSDEEQDLATTMIENSDDDAATDLWSDIGQQTGLAAFDSLVPMADTVPGTDGHWGGTTTTGADQISLLRQLVQPSGLLEGSAQSFELGLMENVESDQAWGVSAGVPAGVTVALKNGWLPLEDDGDWQVNSIGWIDGDGRDYLIAVLTKNNDTEGDGIATVEGLSPLVWNALVQPSA
jgi:beta-lactamase class A